MEQGSNRQRGRSPALSDKIPRTISAQRESTYSFEETVEKKANQQDSVHSSGSTFEERLMKKLKESHDNQGSSRPSSQRHSSSLTFEERLARKMKQGNDMSVRTSSKNSVDSASHMKKTNNSSDDPTFGSSSAGATSESRRKLDDFNERLQRKLGDGMNSNNRFNMQEKSRPDGLTRPRSSSTGATSESRRKLDDFNIRLQRKLDKGKAKVSPHEYNTESRSNLRTSRRDDLTRQRSSSTGAIQAASHRQRDDFDIRLQRKLRKDKANQSKPVTSNESGSLALDEWEERIRKKSSGSARERSTRSTHQASQSYNTVIQRKAEQRGRRSQCPVSPSRSSHVREKSNSSSKQGSISSYERRIEDKLRQSKGNYISSHTSQDSESTFEKRLRRKLAKQEKLERQRSSSLGAQHHGRESSSQQLKALEKRIAAKSAAEV